LTSQFIFLKKTTTQSTYTVQEAAKSIFGGTGLPIEEMPPVTFKTTLTPKTCSNRGPTNSISTIPKGSWKAKALKLPFLAQALPAPKMRVCGIREDFLNRRTVVFLRFGPCNGPDSDPNEEAIHIDARELDWFSRPRCQSSFPKKVSQILSEISATVPKETVPREKTTREKTPQRNADYEKNTKQRAARFDILEKVEESEMVVDHDSGCHDDASNAVPHPGSGDNDNYAVAHPECGESSIIAVRQKEGETSIAVHQEIGQESGVKRKCVADEIRGLKKCVRGGNQDRQGNEDKLAGFAIQKSGTTDDITATLAEMSCCN